jgi:hypothetical protein
MCAARVAILLSREVGFICARHGVLLRSNFNSRHEERFLFVPAFLRNRAARETFFHRPAPTVISRNRRHVMTFKSLALGGAAMVGLALAGVPANAYTHHPATPAEMAQTDQLNAQALQQAQTPDQSAPSNTMASNTASTMQPNSAGQTTAATDMPSGTVALSAIANPPQTLANASVETAQGQAVGAVQKVVTGTDGKTQALDVALLGNQSKIVAIDAAQLSFDQTRNVVIAQLSADQIQALPAAPQG